MEEGPGLSLWRNQSQVETKSTCNIRTVYKGHIIYM